MPQSAFAAPDQIGEGQAAAAQGWPRLYALMLAAFLLDFQSGQEGAGFAIQVVFLAVYTFAFLMFLITENRTGVHIRWLAPLLVTGVLYLGVGVSAGLLNDQKPYSIMRNAISVALYLGTAYATAKTAVSCPPAKLRHLLAWACMAYVISTLVTYSLMNGGIDLSSVRFQIIGSSVLAALGYVILAVMFRLTKVELAALATNLVIVLVTVTRAYVFAFAAQALLLVVEFRRLMTARLVAAGIAALFVGAAVVSFGGGQLTRWEDRFRATDISRADPLGTWYTRTSEWDFMYTQWVSNPQNFMLGSGLAARTNYFLWGQASSASESMVGFGHNQHLSMLFNGGLLGGLPLLILMWVLGYFAFRFLRQVAARPAMRGDLIFLGAWGALIVIGTLFYDMLAATFGMRGNSIWYGIGTGLLLGVQACFDSGNRRRTLASADRMFRGKRS